MSRLHDPSTLAASPLRCPPRGWNSRVGSARQRSSLSALALALVVIGYAAVASAALYKWTDAQGRVVYSDQPPNADVKTEQLRGAPPPANPNAAKELAQRDAEFKKRKADAEAASAKAAREQATSEQRKESCAQAKGELKQLAESQLAIYRYNEKGEREIMDEDARARERAKLNAFMRDNKCPP